MKSINNKPLQIGERVPAFILNDQDGGLWDSRKNLSGTMSIIYFYPKDESAICTKEACAFRDSFTAFCDAGVKVIGINSASVDSHKQFAQKNNLPFTLLSDPQNKVLKGLELKMHCS